MLNRVLDALGALLEDTPVMSRLIDQMQEWGQSQQESRERIIRVLSDVVTAFSRGHAITVIELSKLLTAQTPEDYSKIMLNDLNRDHFYDLFKADDVCRHIHQLRADLESGFGEVKDAIVLQSIKKFSRSLGEFERYEYSLAERYEDYITQVLLGVHAVTDKDSLKDAQQAVIDVEEELSEELRSLSKFKRRIFQLSLIG